MASAGVPAPSRIFGFDDALPEGSDPAALLGGKGANLAEMSRGLGLPVPPGFVITTDACRDYFTSGWPAGLDVEIASALDRLGERLGLRLGDPAAPLLVSVRSGAPVSMPGMMDTVLNVGMTPQIRERLAVSSGDPVFAADTWLRFSRMYADVVLGIPAEGLAEAAVRAGTTVGLLQAAERIHVLAGAGGAGIPADPQAQVRAAVEAVFRSWHSERARVFREQEGLADSLGTAVVIQAMVFGNIDDRSGTGVVFTRDPATGAAGPFGDYLPCAQGEDVVSGTHSVHGLQTLSQSMPEVFAQLEDSLQRLERHYRDMCDVEFTVSRGQLYILQTRIGRRSPLAAVRIAVAMAEDDGFPLTRGEAVARVDQDTLRQLARFGQVDDSARVLAEGLAASPGVGVGVLCCDPDRAADLSANGIGFILAREETSPADIHGMVGASGLITSLGGVASHAAVVARSWAIPAVTGVAGLEVLSKGIRVNDTFIAEGETITVDGGAGTIFAGNWLREGTPEIPEIRTLRTWAAEFGQEPGRDLVAEADPGRTADVTLLELARTVELKGLCSPERAAAALAAGLSRVTELITGHAEFFGETPRGMMLTPAGRDWLAQRLAAEQAAADRETMDRCYERFMALNHEFKRLVSEWQRRGVKEGEGEAWDEVVAQVMAIDRRLRPVLNDIERQVRRLASYGRRFSDALAGMANGDRGMLASPIRDSYHTVWFEYHQELINLCGRDRATEEGGRA